MSETRTSWHGDNPYCLVISERGGGVTLIDLDEPGWVKTNERLMRAEAQWVLARKQGSHPVLTLLVSEGEQPYYTARVFTEALPPPDWFLQQEIEISPFTIKELAQIRAYGIGKKRLDHHVDRLWVLPNGLVCAGDDVDMFGHDLAKQALAQVIERLRNGSNREEGQGRGEEGSVDQGQAGQDRRGGGGRYPGSPLRLPTRSQAAYRRAEQRAASRALASARRAGGRREAGGH